MGSLCTNDSFTLSDTETETDIDTDELCIEPKGNLHRSLSRCSMNTSTQFYTNHFLSILSLSQCLPV